MAKFADLVFGPRTYLGGIRAVHRFDNGYSASVVRGYGTYGEEDGLYELAVIGADGRLAYDTPVTDDVLGHLTEEGVTAALAKIAELPAAESASA